jgi:hypothetical protein
MQNLGVETQWFHSPVEIFNLLALVLSSDGTQIIVSWDIGDTISHVRGIHQRDPISSLLFVAAMHFLTSVMIKVEEAGIFI